MKSKIVLIRFPFTDLTDSKLRPALVIHESSDDVIAAFISSKVPAHLSAADLLVSRDHPSFIDTGLKVASVIKFDKVATVSKDLIEGEIGNLPETLAPACNEILGHIFRL